MNNRMVLVMSITATLSACGDNRTHPTQHAPYDAGSTPPLSCLPNQDGKIEAREAAPVLDTKVSYLVSPALPSTATTGSSVNTAGAVSAEGKRVWDWSADDPTHQVATLQATALSDKWYATSFPAGQFASPYDFSGQWDAVYSHRDDGLYLHGIASISQEQAAKTLLVYEQPIRFLAYPMEIGQQWTAVGTVKDGILRGLSPWSQEDHYTVKIVDGGELRLPDFTFKQVLRASVLTNNKPKTGSTTGTSQRISLFMFECFGEVARATSFTFAEDQQDPGQDFTNAREVRRLGWF